MTRRTRAEMDREAREAGESALQDELIGYYDPGAMEREEREACEEADRFVACMFLPIWNRNIRLHGATVTIRGGGA